MPRVGRGDGGRGDRQALEVLFHDGLEVGADVLSSSVSSVNRFKVTLVFPVSFKC